MSEKRKTLAYSLDDVAVALTIVRATAKIGMERYLLASKGFKENESEENEALKILRTMLYPDLISATVEVKGIPWPLSFNEFIELPEELINEWADAVYVCNPTWRPEISEVAEDSKNEKTSKLSESTSQNTAESPQTKS